jgi:hypothetical protein
VATEAAAIVTEEATDEADVATEATAIAVEDGSR